MDAKKFIQERNRMCKAFRESCNGCPLDRMLMCSDLSKFNPEMVDAVEKWSKENPVKTNRKILQETFGGLTFAVSDIYRRIEVNGIPINVWLDLEYKEPEAKDENA